MSAQVHLKAYLRAIAAAAASGAIPSFEALDHKHWERWLAKDGGHRVKRKSDAQE